MKRTATRMMILKSPIAAFLLCVTTATTAAAYIDDSMMRKYGRKPSNYSPTQWNPKTSVAPKVQQRQPYTSISSPIIMPPAVDVDEIMRAEYIAWSFRYGKTKEDRRYEIFKQNFMLQMEYNRQTGEFYLLNEFGDITAEEYEAMMSSHQHVVEEPLCGIPPVMQMMNDAVSPMKQVAPRIVEMGISDTVVDFTKVEASIANIKHIEIPQVSEVDSSCDDVVDFSKIDEAVASINKVHFNSAVSSKERSPLTLGTVPEVTSSTTSQVVSTDDDAALRRTSSSSTTVSRKNFFSRLNVPTKGALIICLGSMIGCATQAGSFISKSHK